MTTHLKQQGVDADTLYLKTYEEYRLPEWARVKFGTLYGTGDQTNGVLGNGVTSGQIIAPVQIGVINTWKQVSTASGSTLAIKTDGTLWAWGDNSIGQLGLGDTTDRSTPVQVGTSTYWKSVHIGYFSVVAVKTNGTLWAWGSNNVGQLGLGDTTNRTSPTQVGSNTSWTKAVMGDEHMLALRNNNTLWACGQNSRGQLGIGNQTNQTTHVQIAGAWRDMYAGVNASAGIKTDGTLWSWGSGDVNSNGFNPGWTIGSGPLQLTSPAQLNSGQWRSLHKSGHTAHAMAIKGDGTLWAWGYNYQGACGTTVKMNDALGFSQIGALTTWSKVAGSYSHTAAVMTDGTAWVTGYNNRGQLGLNDTVTRTSFTQMGVQTSWFDVAGGTNYATNDNGNTFFMGL